MKRFVLIIITLFSLVSCSRFGIVPGVRVEMVKQEAETEISSDVTFGATFPELLNSHAIKIISDTILVFQEHVNENNPQFFKAYSINTLEYLGAFAYRGRGPDEMLAPHIAESCMCGDYLAINDNAAGKACLIDVQESVMSPKVEIVHSYDLPSNILDWLPLPANQQLMLTYEKNGAVLQACDDGGIVSEKFNLFKGLNADPFFLSSFWVDDGRDSGHVAQVMICFPQINIIDMSSGRVRSIAVDKAWRNWRNIINSRVDMDNIEYYVCATSTSDYIFAAYRGCALGKMNDANCGSSIHVFDWNGRLLHVINVEDNIADIAYDHIGGYLYCIERLKHEVIRYDVNGIL